MAETMIDLWNPWKNEWGTVSLTDAERMLDDLECRIGEARMKERARLMWEIEALQKKLANVKEAPHG